MSGKFIFGMLLGILLSLAIAGAGAYYFLFRGAGQGTQVQPVAPSGDKVADLLGQAGAKTGQPEILVNLRVPPELKDKFPPVHYNVVAQLNAADPATIGGNAQVIPLGEKQGLQYRIRFGLKLVPGAYRLSLILCKSLDTCDLAQARMEARAFFQFTDESGPVINLGDVPFTRYYPQAQGCTGGESLLSGRIEATPEFLALPAAKTPLVLALLTNKNRSGSSVPKLIGNPGDGAEYKNGIYYALPKPDEQYILHAAPIDLKTGSAAFTAPNLPGFDGQVNAYVVECAEGQAPRDCAKRAFPLPASFNSVAGRVYRLVAKEFVVPRCGAKDVHYFLHAFAAPGAPARTQAKPQPELIDGAAY